MENFEEITKSLFKGSSPSPKDVEKLSKDFGIKKIVSLDQRSGDKIKNICKLFGIKQVIIPLDGKIKSILELFKHDIKDLLEKDGPTFFHCYHGKDRSGFIEGYYRIVCLHENPKKVIDDIIKKEYGKKCKPEFVKLFDKILSSFLPETDVNNADIVSNLREYSGDYRDSYLDQSTMKSISPSLDMTRQDPWDFVYNPINDQSPTRENFNEPIKEYEENNIMPSVGIWNNDAGILGVGPTTNSGGFIYE